MIRNRYTTAFFAVCFLLAAVIIPLSQQVLLSSSDVLCEVTDENPEKAPDSEDSTEQIKCILSDNNEQVPFILLTAIEAGYQAVLQSHLCEVIIPPPKTQAV